MYKNLCPEKALIFRITHRDNIPWMLENGLHCRNSDTVDPNFIQIGDPDLIDKRQTQIVPCAPGGTLSDYIPFYFTPFSPMFLNINTGYRGIRKRNNEEIVILVSSLRKLEKMKVPFLFTDRHAYLAAAQFTSDLTRLTDIDWGILQRRDFQRDPLNDPGKVERYEAEALVHHHLPVSAFGGIICYNDSIAKALKDGAAARELNLEIVVKQDWYFR